MLRNLLYVVSRRRPDLYAYLKRLAAEDGIPVILDRREGDRRAAAAAPEVERRRTDRRVRDISGDLDAIGWAIVDLEEPERRRGAS